jgi:orotate phosphoribosyltransferase
MIYKHVVPYASLKNTTSYPTGSNPSAIVRLAVEISNVIYEQFPKKSIYLLSTGASGAMIAGAISALAQTTIQRIIQIRKEAEDCHDPNGFIQVLLNKEENAIIFVDDFISKGTTLHRTIKKINELNPLLTLDGVIVGGTVSQRCLREEFGQEFHHYIHTLYCGEIKKSYG